MDPADLDRLATAAAAGDEDAFTALIRATEGEVRAFVCARAVNLGMVEEIVHACYVTAYTALARYEPRRTLLPWLKGIARNHLCEELRRLRRCQPLQGDPAELGTIEAAEHALEGADEDEIGRLRRCLERLTPRVRRILELRYWQGMELEQVATEGGQSANAIAALLYRARRTLSDCMAGGAP